MRWVDLFCVFLVLGTLRAEKSAGPFLRGGGKGGYIVEFCRIPKVIMMKLR